MTANSTEPGVFDGLRELLDRGRNALDDPPAFWSALTPAQALALLACAPKVAGPVGPTVLGLSRSATYVVTDAIISATDETLREMGWLLVEEG